MKKTVNSINTDRLPVSITDAARLVNFIDKCAPGSAPIVIYGVSNCAFAFGNNNTAINGNNNTPQAQSVPPSAQEDMLTVIERQTKTIDTLINLVEGLTAKIDRLEKRFNY